MHPRIRTAVTAGSVLIILVLFVAASAVYLAMAQDLHRTLRATNAVVSPPGLPDVGRTPTSCGAVAMVCRPGTRCNSGVCTP
jgi:hypothetical protein